VPTSTLGCVVLLVIELFGGLLAGSSRLSQALFTICALLAGMYIFTSLVAALNLAARNGWRVLPILQIVFATHHVAYGLGFLRGLSRRAANLDFSGRAGWSAQ
jgi:hypothetical protein